jgi:hypothetical protein
MPAISRKGDEVFSPDGVGKNCARPTITHVDEINVKEVYANYILAVVAGCQIESHAKRGCSIDTSKLSSFSSTVFIDNKGVGRIGDNYNDNVIIEGSPNVFAG